jgi:hypothetical protein
MRAILVVALLLSCAGFAASNAAPAAAASAPAALATELQVAQLQQEVKAMQQGLSAMQQGLSAQNQQIITEVSKVGTSIATTATTAALNEVNKNLRKDMATLAQLITVSAHTGEWTASTDATVEAFVDRMKQEKTADPTKTASAARDALRKDVVHLAQLVTATADKPSPATNVADFVTKMLSDAKDAADKADKKKKDEEDVRNKAAETTQQKLQVPCGCDPFPLQLALLTRDRSSSLQNLHACALHMRMRMLSTVVFDNPRAQRLDSPLTTDLDRIVLTHVSHKALDACYNSLEAIATCPTFVAARRAAFRRLYSAPVAQPGQPAQPAPMPFANGLTHPTKMPNNNPRYDTTELTDEVVDKLIPQLVNQDAAKIPKLGADVLEADAAAATAALRSANVTFIFPPRFNFTKSCLDSSTKLLDVAQDTTRPYQITWLLLRSLSKTSWVQNTVRQIFRTRDRMPMCI